MTYKDLLKKIAKKEGFDPIYSINNLTVEECFYNDYIKNKNIPLNWGDEADNLSINEYLRS